MQTSGRQGRVIAGEDGHTAATFSAAGLASVVVVDLVITGTKVTAVSVVASVAKTRSRLRAGDADIMPGARAEKNHKRNNTTKLRG